MATDAGSTENPMVNAGTQVGTPVATMGFGAREQADETRQAQQREANDAVADVQMNDLFSRSQGITMDVLGKAFVENHDARQKMADANADWREIQKGRLFGPKPV